MALADEAYEIDATGHLLQIDVAAQPRNYGYAESEETVDTGPSLLPLPAEEDEKATLPPPVTGTESPSPTETERNRLQGGDRPRAITDKQVYRTYAESMGLWHALAFLIAGVAFGVALKLPGNQYLCLSYLRLYANSTYTRSLDSVVDRRASEAIAPT